MSAQVATIIVTIVPTSTRKSRRDSYRFLSMASCKARFCLPDSMRI